MASNVVCVRLLFVAPLSTSRRPGSDVACNREFPTCDVWGSPDGPPEQSRTLNHGAFIGAWAELESLIQGTPGRTIRGQNGGRAPSRTIWYITCKCTIVHPQQSRLQYSMPVANFTSLLLCDVSFDHFWLLRGHQHLEM